MALLFYLDVPSTRDIPPKEGEASHLVAAEGLDEGVRLILPVVHDKRQRQRNAPRDLLVLRLLRPNPLVCRP